VNQEFEVWNFVLAKLKKEKSVTLLLVAESSGSSPGRQGFKMAVAGDEMRGSIGGGAMEVALVEQAKEICDAETRRRGDAGKKQKAKSVGKESRDKAHNSEFLIPQSAILPMVHRKNSPHSSGMICSGKQTVIFFRLDSSHSKCVSEIIRALKKLERKVLQISPMEFKVKPLRGKRSTEISFEKKRAGGFVYKEDLGRKNNLFIVGGGHCALALSEMMSKLNFHITLFDDRPKLNTLEKNDFVHEKRVVKSYEKIASHIASGKNNYVVVMTLGYKSDEVVIRKLFDKKFKYLGVLGSKAKMKTLLRNLEKDGFDKMKLRKIHTPIGIPINSKTPEEIAISIAAEIIGVKNA